MVLDVFAVTTAGERRHTVRPHEGDELVDEEDGGFTIHYGEHEVSVGGEKRKLPGRKVTLIRAHLIEVTRELRFEPRIRPSAAMLRDRDAAEAERIAKKLGVNNS